MAFVTVLFAIVLAVLLCSACQAETVVLRFHATWCGPCKKMRPAWDLARTTEPAIVGAKILDIDVDQNKQAVNDWKVGTIPAAIVVKTRPDGSAFEVGRLTGLQQYQTLVNFLKTHLEAGNAR